MSIKNKIKSFIRVQKHINDILPNLEQSIRSVNEIEWANIFNNTINKSSWFNVQSVSPGRWAMGYPALYILYRILNDIKPKSILEFGLGESTKFTYQYIISQKLNELIIIEHDPEWVEYFKSQIFNVQDYVTLLPLDRITYDGEPVAIYSNLLPNICNKQFDFIIIDGPFGAKKKSRSQILEIIENNLLMNDFIILLDDYERAGEMQTGDLIFSLLNKKSISYVKGVYSGKKDTLIICSEKYRFLTSL